VETEAAEAAGAVAETKNASQTKIIVKQRGSRANLAGRLRR
jgi:hypothetical protein